VFVRNCRTHNIPAAKARDSIRSPFPFLPGRNTSAEFTDSPPSFEATGGYKFLPHFCNDSAGKGRHLRPLQKLMQNRGSHVEKFVKRLAGGKREIGTFSGGPQTLVERLEKVEGNSALPQTSKPMTQLMDIFPFNLAPYCGSGKLITFPGKLRGGPRCSSLGPR